MIPSILSQQIDQGLKDFLSTTFHTTNPFFHGMLERFLDEEGTLNKGPYVSLQLPFQKGESKEFFPDVPLGFTPYRHQEQAFARLSGPEPKPTLIATGTGSGKTECFTQPILEYCRTSTHLPGIKAILLYPMNALAYDQAARLAKTIWNTPGLQGKVAAGLFVGRRSAEPYPSMREDSIITDKDILRQSPPDILLTNYKMLDYLLVRARDAMLWAGNGPETLRFVIVDELHTFDGAQGTDLACLLRRLKARLDIPEGHLCPVGTSATLGGDHSQDQLISYAQKVFGEPFSLDSVITENRQSVDAFLRGHLISLTEIPGLDQIEALSPESYETPEDFIRAQVRLWTGLDIQGADDRQDEWPVELGQTLKRHLFVHNLLRVMDGKVRSIQHILSELSSKATPQLKDGGPEYARLLLNSLLSCISTARIEDESGRIPFIQVRVQSWYRELRRMVCSVRPEPALRFADDLTEKQRGNHLPLLHCRECGQTGWVGRLPLHGFSVQTDIKSIYVDFFRKEPSQRMRMFFPEEDPDKSAAFPGHRMGLCTNCLNLGRRSSGPCEGCAQQRLIPVLVPEAAVKHCPSCGAHNSLTLLGSRSASLTSVMIGQLMTSKYNTDPKCIAFSDNVQDAAHRAGFYSARTYRFTFRAALQQYVEQAGASLNLSTVAQEMPRYWRARLDPETFAATFLPPNMGWLSDVDHLLTHDILPPRSDLCDLIANRLRFEAVSEYGFGSRIGRTLEKSGTSVLRPDPNKFSQVIVDLKQALPNEMEELRDSKMDILEPFLLGLITQFKNQGGIFDPDLDEYVRNWGNVYLIGQRRKIYMPGFGPKTRAPGFITTKPGVERFQQLIQSGSRSTWFEAWAYRHFPVLAMRQPSLGQRFYSLVFDRMKHHGLIQGLFQGNHHVFGLEPDALQVSTKVRQFRCSVCGHVISGAEADAGLWAAMTCLRRGCKGLYESAHSGPDYYGRLYSRGSINRLVAREHTGLLERDTREDLEVKFKASDSERKPWYPNLLSSTPTLEMGIDIGDLSTTLQCSVPPTQANYIQRIGRSGRKTGNGLNFTVASGQAHDLYFFAQPEEMLDGHVLPPGLFLDASAVLERQFTAFCFDRWVQDKQGRNPVPPRLGTVLDTLQHDDSTVFPHNLSTFIAAHLTELYEGFITLFADELSQSSTDHLDRYVFGDTQDAPGLTYRILQRLYDLFKERKALKTQVDRLYREIKRRENNPAQDKNHEQELEELRRERSGLMGLVKTLNAKDTYNFFTDEGLLPNYAFPEQGILLQSVIFRRKRTEQQGQSKYETFTFEYERPARSGLRELAPGNRFYAEGRRVEVDQIDMKLAGVETWRLCAVCPHCEPEARAKKHSLCPRCGSPLWEDQSRKQDLVRLRQVMANAPDRESRIADDADERDPVFYTTQLLVDVDHAAVMDAYQIANPQCPFGFEFISKALFRDINFGPQGRNGETLQVAGEEIERPGFTICRYCGKVQKENGTITHAFGCPARNKESDANFIQSVFLYREFASEAIKTLVPVTGFEGSKQRLDSFVAALQLGLKHHFGGSAYAIEHLQVTLSQEPVPDSGLTKQYLVLYDTVPGGTGFLKQLMRSETMLTVLEKALEVLRACTCQKDPDRDGCYNCLFAYRNSYSMPTTSRDTAIELLSNILSHRDSLRQVTNLKGVSVDGLLDSELEALFLEGLKRLGQQGWSVDLRKEVVRGKPGSFLRLEDQAYEIEPQLELDHTDGVAVPSRSDFVIWPARTRQAGKPIAVFTDGLAFHRQRLGLDMAQRMAILAGGRFFIWSLSWKDVQAQVKNKPDRIADLLHPKDSPLGRKSFVQLLSKLGLERSREWHTKDNFAFLALTLGSSIEKSIQSYAMAQAISFLDIPVSQEAAQREAWLQEVAEVAPDPLREEFAAQLDQAVIGRRQSGPIQLFIRAGRQALQKADPSGIRLLCCLDDEEASQEQVGFERAWINYLRLLNVFQFLPGAVFVTKQGLRQNLYAELMTAFSDEQAKKSDAAASASDDPAWQEAWELADTAVHDLLKELHAQGSQVPDVGFELSINGRVVAEAELAWPDGKVAYLTRAQEEYCDAFQEHGWTVHRVEY